MATQHKSSARELEAELLTHCGLAVAGQRLAADLPEASVFLLAAKLIHSREPVAAGQLRAAANAFLQINHCEPLSSIEILNRGLIAGMPRLRDGLLRMLRRSAA